MNRHIFALLVTAALATGPSLASSALVDQAQSGVQVRGQQSLQVAQAPKRGVCRQGYRYDYRAQQCVKL